MKFSFFKKDVLDNCLPVSPVFSGGTGSFGRFGGEEGPDLFGGPVFSGTGSFGRFGGEVWMGRAGRFPCVADMAGNEDGNKGVWMAVKLVLVYARSSLYRCLGGNSMWVG